MLLNISDPLLFSASPNNGLPPEIEFACTSQILPTTIQKLYGRYISLMNIANKTIFQCPRISPQREQHPKSSHPDKSGFITTPLEYVDESIPRCTVDIVRISSEKGSSNDGLKSISLSEYYSQYIEKKKPVVIRGVLGNSIDWTFPGLKKLGEQVKVAYHILRIMIYP